MLTTLTRSIRVGLLATAWLTINSSAQAYVVISEGNDHYNKWGASLSAGTSGGIVTWGFMAAGTAGSAYCGSSCLGSSVLDLPNFYANPASSNTTSVLSPLNLRAMLRSAFDRWASVANVRFVFVGVDNSRLQINDPVATNPMIRIGAFNFDSSFFCRGRLCTTARKAQAAQRSARNGTARPHPIGTIRRCLHSRPSQMTIRSTSSSETSSFLLSYSPFVLER